MTTITAHRARLCRMVKALVIEQGYLEHWQEQSSHDLEIAATAAYLDDAIATLTEYLEA